MSLGDWFQLGSLIVACVGLSYLIKYVRYTHTIAEQSVLQTEAAFKPAIVATHGGSTSEPPTLRNIGKGPAMEIEWSISDTSKRGKISYLEPGDKTTLPVEAMSLYVGAMRSKNDDVTVMCSYKSVSGKEYTSVSSYDFDRGRFTTVFEASGLSGRDG